MPKFLYSKKYFFFAKSFVFVEFVNKLTLKIQDRVFEYIIFLTFPKEMHEPI